MVANSEKPVMRFDSVDAWEAWLAAHEDHPGVRLQLRKKRSTAPGITYDEALESALCFGWIDGQIYGLDADYSLQVFTPRRPRSAWSQRNVGIVARLTEEGRMRSVGLAQVERAQADGRWAAAYRQKCMEVPADLRAAPRPHPPRQRPSPASPRSSASASSSGSTASCGPRRGRASSPATSRSSSAANRRSEGGRPPVAPRRGPGDERASSRGRENGSVTALEHPAALTVLVLPGIGEIVPGDDLPALIAHAAAEGDVRPGDILAVTSKIVSKAEGRIREAADREQAITDETVRVVATREHPGGVTRIVENRLGLVMAAAGVDASNTADGTVLLLPLDPDASAAAIRAAVEDRVGGPVGVVITDTAGRAWREGQTDIAIGASGVRLLDDLRGGRDASGKLLEVTAPAVGDEIAAAADLVKGKSSGMPVAVIRGMARLLDAAAPGGRQLVRRAEEDMFYLGHREARAEGRAAGYAEGYEAGLAAGRAAAAGASEQS